jgi:tetratricopeptide (TPR) repeat protein
MSNTTRERLALARAHVRRGEVAAAEAIYSTLVQDFPAFADVHNEAGLFFHEQGDFDRAQASFLDALKINPSYTEAALHLSITWNDMGRYEDAQRVYAEALVKARASRDVLDPPLAQRIVNLYADIGDVYAQAREWKRSAAAYREGLALGPNFHDVRLRLAQVLLDAGDSAGAVVEAQQVVDASPDFRAALLMLGLACLAAGDRSTAARTWHDVLEREPAHKRAAMYLRLMEKR